jgi:hypothetical protein
VQNFHEIVLLINKCLLVVQQPYIDAGNPVIKLARHCSPAILAPIMHTFFRRNGMLSDSRVVDVNCPCQACTGSHPLPPLDGHEWQKKIPLI